MFSYIVHPSDKNLLLQFQFNKLFSASAVVHMVNDNFFCCIVSDLTMQEKKSDQT